MSAKTGEPAADPQLEALLEFVRASRGVDLGVYKRANLTRRVTKRMREAGYEDLDAYRDHLEAHPEEFVILLNTILINVTAFFRDTAAWDVLRNDIVPRILAGKDDEEPIRIWSTGCASGEEAYSLAIVFAEALGEEVFRRRVKIYATDIDEDALAHARRGAYSEADVEPVSPALREKYFEPSDGRFVFRGDLRRVVIFGRHDLMTDAPISRLDLLACRNTLMYFNAEAQRGIAARLHFALCNGGFIFLGRAEMLSAYSDLFAPADLQARIFSRLSHPPSRGHLLRIAAADNGEPPRAAPEGPLRRAGFDALPLGHLVVDAEGILVLANRHARRLFGFFRRDLGRAFRDLEVSYRPLELRSILKTVMDSREAVNRYDVDWPSLGGEHRVLDVCVTPLIGPGGDLLGAGITFHDATRRNRLQQELHRSSQELESAYEELQSTNEELETTNEELQSTIEELETTNEELQSSNEEMETMNEELQSTNEELQTINDELQQRTGELNNTNAFLESIFAGLDSGVVVVDRDLHVEIWSRRAEDLWGLRSEEAVGEHLLNLDIGLPVDRLKDPVRSVLGGDGAVEDVVLDARNRLGKEVRCRVFCTPRLDSDKEVRGVILLMEQMSPA